MTREKLVALLTAQNTEESRFALACMKRREGKVWDKTVGRYGAWVAK